MPDTEYEIPNDRDVTPEDIEPGADLREADLTDADLKEANLTNADLTYADLLGADLTDANLGAADLPNANLPEADLTDADLRLADLTDAKLVGTDLTDADIRYADLTNAILSEIELTGATIARSTRLSPPGERAAAITLNDDPLSKEQQWDLIARTNHELRTAYSANGLTGRAQRARVRERKARRREARAQGGRGWLVYLWSCGSQLFTGYGIQLRWIGFVMLALWLFSAGVYWNAGMAPRQSLYYSIVTFTTSPPTPPAPGVAKTVAGFETFAGTAAIVFLGYVLGTRERV